MRKAKDKVYFSIGHWKKNGITALTTGTARSKEVFRHSLTINNFVPYVVFGEDNLESIANLTYKQLYRFISSFILNITKLETTTDFLYYNYPVIVGNVEDLTKIKGVYL